MRFLLNLGEVSALQSLRIRKSWHLRQGCMKIHRLAWVEACFSSPPALFSKMHVFFSLLGCLQLFYHWQAGMALRRYQIRPQHIIHGNWWSWVKRLGQAFVINANAKANTEAQDCLSICIWFSSTSAKRKKKDVDVRLFMDIWQTVLFKISPVYWDILCLRLCLEF